MKMKNILLTSLLFSLSAAFCSETVLFLEDFESRNTPPGSSAALTAHDSNSFCMMFLLVVRVISYALKVASLRFTILSKRQG